MTSSTNSKKNANSDIVIVGCNAMLESKEATSSGKLVFIEGDIIEMNVGNSRSYELGDSVKLVVYSPDGILNMQTSVVARDKESVYLITPEKILQLYLKRRKQPRVNIELPALIVELYNNQKKMELEGPMEALLCNIAMGGTGLNTPAKLMQNQVITLSWDMEEPLKCQAKIVHQRSTTNGNHYGAEFVNFPKAKINLLRAFILRQQIQNRQEDKRNQPIDDINANAS